MGKARLSKADGVHKQYEKGSNKDPVDSAAVDEAADPEPEPKNPAPKTGTRHTSNGKKYKGQSLKTGRTS
ncbi:hypothetical protein ONS95_002756 [Cadophora gregata]|uniref:uncharacterized protein n=1 Tax=Cadophora gregata TaxID=51156 RepID=UPI0026DA8015|nr:uncharacterized protein ONS95_002756 [Cadophora gregata]KAK0110100.1 hypothetical protein ONS95_002756 [Cadophora gregata]KAK0110281.1 hypothetical protein ONS96_001900 [Cadophora gregata f. sp. sojae]